MKTKRLIPVFLILSILLTGIVFAGTVNGVVTDAKSGAALEGVTVLFFSQTGDSTNFSGVSGSDGSYTITGVADGSYNVMVENIGYETFSGTVTVAGDNATTLNIALKHLPGQGVLSGKVVYKDDNTPAAGLMVALIGKNGEYTKVLTDAAGNYSASVATGDYQIVCQLVNNKGMTYSLYYDNVATLKDAKLVTVPENGKVENINFKMPKDPQFTSLTLKVSGKITDIAGKALSGVMVGRVFTDMAGLDSINVNLFNSGTINNSCLTDDKGEYKLEIAVLLAPGQKSEEVKLMAMKQGYYTRYYQNTENYKEAAAITVSENVTLSKVDFTLRFGTMPGHGYVSGRVTEEGDGKAIPFISVDVIAKSGNFLTNTVTDADGNYQVIVPAGDYVLAVTRWNVAGLVYREYYNNVQKKEDAETVTVKTGEQTKGIDFALPAFKDLPTYKVTITGKVVDENDKPIKKANIGVWAMDGAMMVAAKDTAIVTDAEGKYSFKCKVYNGGGEVAKLVVFAEKENCNIQFYNGKDDLSQADVIEITKDSDFKDVNFKLCPIGTGSGQYSISGKLTDEKGAPIVSCLAVAVRGKNWHPVWALSDKEGKYNIKGLAEGSYIIQFMGETYAPEYYDDKQLWEDAKKIEVNSDVVDIDAVLATMKADSVGVIAGTIKDINGNLLSGVTVTAKNQAAKIVDAQITGKDGHYSIRGLSSVTYTLYVSKQGLGSKTISVNIAVNSINDIVLQPTGTTDVAEQKNLKLPIQVALKGNYPNPFNPETTIRYYLPAAGKASIKIYNILGGLVKILQNDRMAAGEHSVIWHGLDSRGNMSPSGIYLVVLETGKQLKCHRIVLSK